VKCSIEWSYVTGGATEKHNIEMLVNVQNWSVVKLKEAIIERGRKDLPTSVEEFDLYFPPSSEKKMTGILKDKQLHKRLKRATKIELRHRSSGRAASRDPNSVAGRAMRNVRAIRSDSDDGASGGGATVVVPVQAMPVHEV